MTDLSRTTWTSAPRVHLVAILMLTGVVLASTPTPARAQSAPMPFASETAAVVGAEIVGTQWLTPRTLQLTVATPSFTTAVRVEVMFPAGYEADTDRRWPVTYYTAGTNHDEATFRDLYGGEELTASYESLVVTPSGHAGYWSDHDNAGAGGPPMYETFVIDQLIPLIDSNFRTLADRAHRVVLGDSMGGYGALMLAARHPDLFSAASSLSGAVDTNWVPQTAVTTLSPTLQLADIQPPDSIYGPRATQEVRWRGHNPTDLAANLRTVDLQLYTGNGVLGPQELGDPGNAAGCVLEAAGIRPETDSLHSELLTLGVAHRYTAYTWGCHSVALFRQEIVETLARFRTVLAKPASAPVSFSHRFVEPQADVFGWSVTTDPHRAAEFLELREASVDGFTVTGSGRTIVSTPPLYRGSRPVTVLVHGIASSARPDASGRITVLVDLGPANETQQYTLGTVSARQTSVVRLVRN